MCISTSMYVGALPWRPEEGARAVPAITGFTVPQSVLPLTVSHNIIISPEREMCFISLCFCGRNEDCWGRSVFVTDTVPFSGAHCWAFRSHSPPSHSVSHSFSQGAAVKGNPTPSLGQHQDTGEGATTFFSPQKGKSTYA